MTLALTLILSVVQGDRWAVAAEPHGKRAEAKVEFDKAQMHYRLGRFEEALQAYSRAYELFNAPALLFNIGQCHKNLQNYERAIFFFEGYLREETNPDKRALAQELIAASRSALERQRVEPVKVEPLVPLPPPGSTDVGSPPPPPTTSTRTGEPVAATPLPAATEPPAATTEPVLVASPPSEPPPADEERPLYRTWWFWTAVGVGAAAIATGAAIYYATGPTTSVLPAGSLGTLDRRR